jgi:hypothetical protein
MNNLNSLSAWIPSLATSGLLGIVFWLSRSLIEIRLRTSVQNEFDSKLESLKGDIRASEERLRARLREKEAEIEALRTGALSAMTSRQVALDKRRLEAVDQLWATYTELNRARYIAAFMAVIKFEEAAKEAENNDRARQAFDKMGMGFDLNKLDLSGASKARPFLPHMVWAVFAAIQAITTHSIIRWTALKTGMGNKNLFKDEPVKELILAVLPTYKNYLEKFGPSSYYYVLEALDQKLLAEIQGMLSGTSEDMASVERASKIVELAGKIGAKDAMDQVARP